VDDVWSLIGSSNWDARSFRLNFELNLSVFDAEFAIRIREHFDRAFLQAHEITLDEINKRTLPVKLRDCFFHLFAPYL
jgi:cardiolipin synthase